MRPPVNNIFEAKRLCCGILWNIMPLLEYLVENKTTVKVVYEIEDLC